MSHPVVLHAGRSENCVARLAVSSNFSAVSGPPEINISFGLSNSSTATATGSAPALKRPPGRAKVTGVLGSSRSLPRLRATGAARSPESTRVLAAVGATRQKYSRPRPVSGQYEPVLRGGGTAAVGGIRPVPEHLTWYSKTK